jgi:hypothetical protein
MPKYERDEKNVTYAMGTDDMFLGIWQELGSPSLTRDWSVWN